MRAAVGERVEPAVDVEDADVAALDGHALARAGRDLVDGRDHMAGHGRAPIIEVWLGPMRRLSDVRSADSVCSVSPQGRGGEGSSRPIDRAEPLTPPPPPWEREHTQSLARAPPKPVQPPRLFAHD